jgi:hypothetical protein
MRELSGMSHVSVQVIYAAPDGDPRPLPLWETEPVVREFSTVDDVDAAMTLGCGYPEGCGCPEGRGFREHPRG